jgi:hypothetical protein
MPDSPVWNPDAGLFRQRLIYLIDAVGYEGVEASLRRGGNARSRQTIRRWARGEATPSARVRRGINRSARRFTGPAQQTRPGSAGRVQDPNVATLRENLRRDLTRRRTRAQRAATTPSMRAAADALPTEPDENLLGSLDNQRYELIRREAEGEEVGPGTLLSADWDEWREIIEAEYLRITGTRRPRRIVRDD